MPRFLSASRRNYAVLEDQVQRTAADASCCWKEIQALPSGDLAPCERRLRATWTSSTWTSPDRSCTSSCSRLGPVGLTAPAQALVGEFFCPRTSCARYGQHPAA